MKTKAEILGAIVLAAVNLPFASEARADLLFGTDSRCDCLFTIDSETGQITTIGDLGPSYEAPVSMAVDLDGSVYVVDNTAHQLLRVHIETGEATAVGSPGLPTVGALAINRIPVPGPGGVVHPPGTLFASDNRLLTIDKFTGETTIIGWINPPDPTRAAIGGLAFRSDGVLFGAEALSGTDDQLLTIDTATGAGTPLGTIEPDFSVIGGLVFTPDDVLLGSDLDNFNPKLLVIEDSGANAGTISDVVPLASTPLPLAPQGLAFSGSCFSQRSESLIHCDDAVANDFCDSELDVPSTGYLRDGVWDGTSCRLCLGNEMAADDYCTDGLDNDCDGLVDCADDECMQSGACTFHAWANTCADFVTGVDYGIYETSCADGRDNDGDGHTDCLDRDCIFGPECPSLQDPVDVCLSCTDRNNNGQIFQDFTDLSEAGNASEREEIYRCAQIYKPYCLDEAAPDPMSPSNAARDFLDWMRDKGYLGRIIAIHAKDLNDPVKRAEGEKAHFQKFFDVRNEGSPPSRFRGPFKAAGDFPIDFVELRALDADIENDINTQLEVEEVLGPYFEDQIFGRSIALTYVDKAIDYAAHFGDYAECAPPNPRNQVCFDPTTLRSGMIDIFRPFTATPTYENWAGHFGASKLTDGRQVRLRRFFQTIHRPHEQLTTLDLFYAHEYGHALGLSHPLAFPCLERNADGECVSVDLYNPRKDVGKILGTCGVMALAGYVYGCVERLEPLYRYALEPVEGYKDDATFGLQYSEEVLGACDAPPPSGTTFDNIQDEIDTKPAEFSVFFTDGPPIPGNGELSSTSGGTTFGQVLAPGLVSVEELPNPAGVLATSSSADDVQLIMCDESPIVTLSDAGSVELSCASSITAIAPLTNTELVSIQAGPPFYHEGPKIEALVPPGGEVTISRANGWTVDSPTGVTVSLLESSPEGPDEPDEILVAVEQRPHSVLRYGPPEDGIIEIEVLAGTAEVTGPSASKVLDEGQILRVATCRFPPCSADSEGPVTTDVTVDPSVVEVDGDVELTAIVDDSGTGNSDIASADYRVDQGQWWSMDPADDNFDSPMEEVEISLFAPSTAGVYDVCVHGTDVLGNIGEPECAFLVAYDPSGGFVTGGGWIDSREGAYVDDDGLTPTGKANFGFVSKYKKGARVPTGNTEFQFKVADLNFKSTSYEWLVIAGDNARYKGIGTINGEGSYKFMLWGGDGTGTDGADTFRIRIWTEHEATAVETPTYDNGHDQAIGGGSVVIHQAK